MQGASAGGGDWSGRAGARGPGRAGLWMLVPGYPQWAWRQRERGLALFGSFLTALLAALFAWGTSVGWLVLGFAFATHVVSVADVVRQRAFPGFGRWVPLWSASAGLGVCCYGPLVALGLICAWPGGGHRLAGEGYLINRAAYWGSEPATGQSAWAQLPDAHAPQLVKVLAGPGQGVEWSESGLRVEGQGVTWTPRSSGWRPRELAFKVPDGQVLVAVPPARPGRPSSEIAGGLLLVAKARIGGRAWARIYPIWERCLLP